MAKKEAFDVESVPPEIRNHVKDRVLRMQQGTNIDRTVFFSDAVLAIAMTLLALDLKLPDLPEDISQQGLNDALINRIPSLVAFMLSFWMIGRVWISHHRQFEAIKAYDAKLQVRNLIMLFFVAFLPVPTAALFTNGPQTPWTHIIYALTLMGMYLSQRATWTYAYKAGLTEDWVDKPLFNLIQSSTLPVTVVMLLSIPVNFISPSWGLYFLILIWPASSFYGKYRERCYERDEATLLMKNGLGPTV